MAAPSISTKTARTETKAKQAWLEERRTYLGATDISAIRGISPYASPHDVWRAKKGLSEDESKIAMRVGTYLEPFIALEFAHQKGVKVRRSKLYRHPKFPFLACNPDREFTMLVDGQKIPALLECKSVGYFASANFGQDGSDQIPEHYMTQILWQMIVTGRKVVALAALVDNRELRVFYYTLDPNYSTWAHVFDELTVRRVASFAKRWWERYIEGDEEPEMTGHDSDHSYMQKVRPSYENGHLTNTDEATDALCVRLGKAKVRKDRAQYVHDELANRIKAYMAKNRVSELESTVGTFKWKTNVRGVATFTTPFKSNKA